MIKKFTILNINYSCLNFFILAFLLLPNTNASSRACSNGQTIFDLHVTISSGGLVSPKSGSDAPDGADISVYTTGTTYQSTFTSVGTFSADTAINKIFTQNDPRTEGSPLAVSINSNNWRTNMALIGNFGATSAATFATESYIVPVKLTEACKYISVPGIDGSSYLNSDALKNNKAT